MRWHREEQKGRNRKLSSRKLSGHGRKKMKARRTIRKVRTRSKHLRNSCGSESGKGERKRTVVLSTRTVKGCMRNQAKGNGENIWSESGRWALTKLLLDRVRKRREQQKQRLSSQNPGLTQTKGSDESGGKKEEAKQRNLWSGKPKMLNRKMKTKVNRWKQL